MSTRIDKRLLKGIDFIAKVEMSDRGNVIRKLLRRAVHEWYLDYAIRLYKEGKISLWRAAKIARLGLWEFIEILKKRNILLNYSIEDLEEDIKSAAKSGK